ncbi:MAG: rRNA maturation RNase YbeY [Bacillota bacterium]
MVKVQINNKQKEIEIEEDLLDLFEDIAQEAARIEGYDSGEISIGLINNEEIKILNRKYRDTDEVTDVLSFPMGEEIWGDILISVEKVVEQAEEYNHSFAREACYLIIHGVLHLLGYDHKSSGDKKDMRRKEERVLSKFNLDRD